MTYLVVCAVALGAALLTLFSGFGLGTLLLPAFALFFAVEIAVAATAVVHLANNLFKLALIGRDADGAVVLRFGLPAAGAAGLGALALGLVGALPALVTYQLGGSEHAITPVKLAIGLLIVAFVLIERLPRIRKLALPRKWLPLGGALSGFFGGLSGHQGALRSMFLVKAGLDARAFVATAAICSTIVDLVRLAVYITLGATAFAGGFGALDGARPPLALLGAACLCAFLGSFLGARLLGKVTIAQVERVVAIALLGAGLAIASGLI